MKEQPEIKTGFLSKKTEIKHLQATHIITSEEIMLIASAKSRHLDEGYVKSLSQPQLEELKNSLIS